MTGAYLPSLFGPAPTGVGQDLLAGYMTARSDAAAVRAEALAGRSGGSQATDTVDIRTDPKAVSTQALSRFMSERKLLDGATDRTGTDKQVNALVRLDKALREIGALAELVRSDSLAQQHRGILEETLQGYLAEARAFLADAPLHDIELTPGAKTDTVSAGDGVAYAAAVIERRGIVKEATDTIPGLTADDRFTLTIDRFDEDGEALGTETVTVDMADIDGALTLEAVLRHINGALAATGTVETRFIAAPREDGTLGLAILEPEGLEGRETLTLATDPATRSPAVYLAGETGSDGFVQRLEPRDGAVRTAFSETLGTPGADGVSATATDADGNVYVLGTTDGAPGTGAAPAERDAYLAKYAPDGTLLFHTRLGGDDTEGTALALDGDGNIVVAGTRGPSAFVTKLDPDGGALFTHETHAADPVFGTRPDGQASGLSLATDADGNIFLAGTVTGQLSPGDSAGAGQDGFLLQLDGEGGTVAERRFGSAGSDATPAVAVDGDGRVYLAAIEDGRTVVRRFADAAAATPDWAADLGALGAGAVAGLALGPDGALLLAGTTGAALPGAAVTGRAAGSEGFVLSLDAASGAAGGVRYLGAGSTVGGLTVAGDGIYLAGAAESGFALRLDAALDETWRKTLPGGSLVPRVIAVAPEGADTLTRLGLPEGRWSDDRIVPEPALSALSTAQVGDSFEITVSGGVMGRLAGGRTTTVRIEPGDTRLDLQKRIAEALHGFGSVSWSRSETGRHLQVTADDGATVTLTRGPSGGDALAALGLAPATLTGAPLAFDTAAQSADARTFGLGLDGELSLATEESTERLAAAIKQAISTVSDAYTYLRDGPDGGESEKKPGKQGSLTPALQAYYSRQMSQYQEALARLGVA